MICNMRNVGKREEDVWYSAASTVVSLGQQVRLVPFAESIEIVVSGCTSDRSAATGCVEDAELVYCTFF